MYIDISASSFDGKNTLVYYARAIPAKCIDNPIPFRGEGGETLVCLPDLTGKWSKGEPEGIGVIAYSGEPDEHAMRIFKQDNILTFDCAGETLLRKLDGKGYHPGKIDLFSFKGKPDGALRTVEPCKLEELAEQLTSLGVNASLL